MGTYRGRPGVIYAAASEQSVTVVILKINSSAFPLTLAKTLTSIV